MSVFSLTFTGDAYQGPPIADIILDGVAQPSVPITAAHGSPVQAVPLILAPGPHSVIIRFGNAINAGPGKARALYFQGATLDDADTHMPTLTFKNNGSATLIVVAPPIPAPPVDIAALLGKLDMTGLNAKIDALLALETAEATAPATAPATPATPATPPGLNLANIVLVAGGTTLLEEGSYAGVLDIAVPQTIRGKGMRRTLQDDSAGIRLAWGKGGLHIRAPDCVISDIGFMHDGSGASDGEAGIYLENFTGLATLLRCAFDGDENGIFMPDRPSDTLIDLLVDQCVFGRIAANGEPDERSHNLYVGGRTVTIKKSIILASVANTVKVRGPSLDMQDSFLTRRGRFIDCPGETIITTARNSYVTPVGSDSQNAFGFFDEADINANPCKIGSWQSVGDKFYFSRFNEVLWVNDAAFRVEFINPEVHWIGSPGSQPPNVTIQGPGSLAGVNPFVFNESNRVDNAPDVPADPVAA